MFSYSAVTLLILSQVDTTYEKYRYVHVLYKTKGLHCSPEQRYSITCSSQTTFEF